MSDAPDDYECVLVDLTATPLHELTANADTPPALARALHRVLTDVMASNDTVAGFQSAI